MTHQAEQFNNDDNEDEEHALPVNRQAAIDKLGQIAGVGELETHGDEVDKIWRQKARAARGLEAALTANTTIDFDFPPEAEKGFDDALMELVDELAADEVNDDSLPTAAEIKLAAFAQKHGKKY